MARKKKAEAKPIQYGYKVTMESYCNESYHSGKQFGEWRESYTNHLKSIAARDDKYPDVNSIHKIEPGQGALVVWIEWSTGDSFGHGDRTCTEIMGLFKDMESALSLKTQIESWIPNKKAKKWEDTHSYHFKTPDGQEFSSGFAPWSGYFESLDSVNVDAVIIF